MANIDINSSEERIGKMLSNLKRVEPPSDFDFRVKARIAKGRPAVGHVSWLPASLRVALPLVLLLVGGYFAFSFLSASGDANVPIVADAQETRVEPVAPPVDQSETTVAEVKRGLDPIEVKPPVTDDKMIVKSGDTISPELPITMPMRQPKAKGKIGGGGSFDEAVRETRRILPRGFDPNVRVTTTANTAGGSQVSAKEILIFIGIDMSFASGWRVNSVSPNSIAGRSGVRAGDVIEAINSRVLNESSSFESGFTGSSLRLRRGLDIINITLRN